MTPQRSDLQIVPFLDSDEMAADRRRELGIPRDVAVALGKSAVDAAVNGYYFNRAGQKVDWSHLVDAACSAKRSIPPDVALQKSERAPFSETRIQVTNETTLGASLWLVESGLPPLALNFANGIHPEGGFSAAPKRRNRRCVDPALFYRTLITDPMYDAPAIGARPDASGEIGVAKTYTFRGYPR